MRTLALCLLLVPALLGARPGLLHAGDDDGETARLERRVEMLLDLVAELHAEVEALRERVAKLEAERTEPKQAAAVPKVESIPAIPIVPVPIVVWPEVSGVYALDKDASVEAILKLQLEDVEDEEMAEMIRQGIAGEFESVSITLRIEGNGTFFVRLEGMGEEEGSTARGTWKRDVSHVGPRQRLIFVTTHEDGVEEADPTELVGTWEDGRLVLEEQDGDESGYVMIFRRK